jgi:thioredoxin reductase (NADPH)
VITVDEKPVLLAVDDREDDLGLVERLLAEAYGERYRVLAIRSAREALDTLGRLADEHQPVALVLADLHLPQTNGVELLGEAARITPAARRVLLVSRKEEEDAIRALKAVRIDLYVVAPYARPEADLFPALDDLLAGWEAARLRFDGVAVVGYRFSPRSHETRDFLVRNGVPFRWLDVDRDEEARRLVAASGTRAHQLPLVIFPDGSRLVQPTNAALGERIGLEARAGETFYDLVIVGAGPAGLAAAVYGASEGLRTVMVERRAPGGQAGQSALIESYLGFPAGLTGADLTRRAVAQAREFEVEIVTPQAATALRAEGASRVVTLGDGSELRGHAVLLATGVEWRRLDAPGVERLTGVGIHYGGTETEAFICRGEDVYIVGGGNSAGQAALHFARHARAVTLLAREDSLSASMSRYLVEQVEGTANVGVRLRTVVIEAHGDDRLEAITIRDEATGGEETMPTNALFVFIGGAPHTEWLAGAVARDGRGYILSGPERAAPRGEGHGRAGWNLARDPFSLESSIPGVFVAGDVRRGSVKRVAAGVGEGAAAIQSVHRYLSPLLPERDRRPRSAGAAPRGEAPADRIDTALDGSFPASDAPPWWIGPSEEPDP